VTAVILENCRLFEPREARFIEARHLLIESGTVSEVSDVPLRSDAARRIEMRGLSVLPGLIDAHFHAYGADFDVRRLDSMPMSLLSQYARRALEGALQRGFTTVRDAAGADIGLKLALDRGLIAGPRLYFSGRAISQTGGHGDPRAADAISPCGCGYSGVLSQVADGPEAVRHAAREELRKGATQLKVFLSGGVISPTDPIWMPQMTPEEIRAAVEEAATRRTYVMAHAHTAEAVSRAIESGVRSIEHATMLDAPTAKRVADTGVFVVPTLAVLHLLTRMGEALGLTPVMRGKADELVRHAQQSLDSLCKAGAQIGFGTDLLGSLMDRQSQELVIRREVMGAADILRSATLVNAALLGESGRLGELVPGACADLIAVKGDPLEDIAVLADPANMALVMKSGRVMRGALPS
jgi:imidazolonepropionase-like amidohydrolase